jgi:predicted ATPase
VAGAVGVREEAGLPLRATLLAALRPRRLLLVLDNCEHLLDASATLVEALLRGCPQVTVLATSREALGIAGERVWRVPSLALPDGEHLPSPEVLAQVEAVRLFVERALAVQPHFALTAQNAPLVAQICRRLDGIPLALELASARLGGLSIDQLAARLDQRFRLLTGGSRTALPRQQTLQATVDWSYGLLGVAEQTLFNRLAVFAGGFTLDAAEAVCAGRPIAAEDVLELLLRLVARSLVTAEEREGNVERYRLLETLRQYGRARLLAGGEAEDLYARHTSHCCALAEEAERAMFGPLAATWIDRLDAEYPNFREALRWALEAGAAWEGLRLAQAITNYWFYRGYLAEGARWLSALLALPDAAARIPARVGALCSLGFLQRGAGLLVGSPVADAPTKALLTEALAIARECSDKPALCAALFSLGRPLIREDYAAGHAMLDECEALYRELNDQPWLIDVWNTFGDVAWEQGDPVTAHRWWSQALRLAREAGNQNGVALQLGDLGMMAFHQGDYHTARSLIAESLALYRTLHEHQLVALALGCLGAVARAQGDTDLARSCYEEKLAFWRHVGDRTGIAATLDELGAVALQEGGHTPAQALFEEALTLRRELGDSPRVAASQAHLGDLARAQGDYERAATRYREGLAPLRHGGDRPVMAACLEGMAAIAMACVQPERSAHLLGAAAGMREGTFVLYVWDDRAARERLVAAVRAALGDVAFAVAWAAGQAMTPDDAIATVLEDGAGG